MFFKQKKVWMLTLIIGVLVFGALAFNTPTEENNPEHPNNLKVLPKDISHDDLMDVMKSFTVALNFKCGDCHAQSSEDSTRLDFLSYDNPKKKVALGMMKMVQKINKDYFKVKGDFKANYLNSKFQVTCETCHRGTPHPRNTISIPIDHWKEKKKAENS